MISRDCLNCLWARLLAAPSVFIMCTITGALVVSGPFGTLEDYNFWERLKYWGLVVVISTMTATALQVWVERNFKGISNWRLAAAVIVGQTIVFTPILWLITDSMADDGWEANTPAWSLFPIVFGVSVIVMGTITLLREHFAGTPQPRLLDRLSKGDVKRIYRITVRDHYVDVFTDCGVETLLMRFSDAISELEGLNGQRVHRSHWVANEAMVRIEKQNGKSQLLLDDGSVVPVSRSYQAAVEERLN